MRQAIVSVEDGTSDVFGMEELLAVVREAGPVETELLSCEGTRGVTRTRVEDPLDEERLNALESVEWWERVTSERSEHVYLVGFDAPDPPEVEDVCADDALLTERFEITEDGYRFDVTGPEGELSDVLHDHERAGLNLSLERLREYRDPGASLDALTARQREVLEAAYDLGYYDVPRSATTDEVAAKLDLDDSTVSEHLQRAERNLIGSVLGE